VRLRQGPVIKADTPICIHERLFKVCGGAAVDVGAVGQGLGRIKAKETVRSTFRDTPSNVNSLRKGRIANCAHYIAVLRRQTECFPSPSSSRKNISEMQLLYDNVRPHTTLHFTERPSLVLDGQCDLVQSKIKLYKAPIRPVVVQGVRKRLYLFQKFCCLVGDILKILCPRERRVFQSKVGVSSGNQCNLHHSPHTGHLGKKNKKVQSFSDTLYMDPNVGP
jgi:hypothetical protein